jgi:hypothetical protein
MAYNIILLSVCELRSGGFQLTAPTTEFISSTAQFRNGGFQSVATYSMMFLSATPFRNGGFKSSFAYNIIRLWTDFRQYLVKKAEKCYF